jgi:DNA repair exonuclease SbcCD nuclease subunit
LAKLLHTSDWQIGKLYGQFEPDESALLAEARFAAVERVARLATEERVDLVLVAGDVFDAQTVADKTLHRLFNAMAGYTGAWVLISGNHDAGLAESVWTRAARLDAIPAHVHICLRPEPLLLQAIRVAVLPAPLTQRHTYHDATEWFAGAATPPGWLRIGLAHGSVQGILAEGIDSPNPIAADRAEQAKLDYLALGDWHGTRQIDARTWYSGTPETDRFRANDSGQALLVELSEPGAPPKVRPMATGRYRWLGEAFTLQVRSDLDEALQRLAAFGPADVVQLELSGRIDLDGYGRLSAAIEQARGRARSLLADLAGLRLEPTDEDIAALRADGYLGEVLAELRASQDGPEGDAAGEALALLVGILAEQRLSAGGAA